MAETIWRKRERPINISHYFTLEGELLLHADAEIAERFHGEPHDVFVGARVGRHDEVARLVNVVGARAVVGAALRLEDGVYLLLRTALAPEEGVRTGEGTESLRSLAARGLARRELGETAGSLERVFRPEWKRIRMDLLFRQDLN